MAKRRPRYSDALRLFGVDDSTLAGLAEKAADAGMGALGVPDLFGLRTELVAQGRRLLDSLRERITGVSRLTRTERLYAAHAILVGQAFFEALEEALDEKGSPLRSRDLALSDGERQRLVEDLSSVEAYRGLNATVDQLLNSPSQRGSLEERARYVRLKSEEATNHLQGCLSSLGAWTKLGAGEREETRRRLESVPQRAARRYRESYLRLAGDAPEFAAWAHMTEHLATRHGIAKLDTGLGDLERLLRAMSPHGTAQRQRGDLATIYRAALAKPLMDPEEDPDLEFPTLAQGYLAPRGRRGRGEEREDAVTFSSATWWEQCPVEENLQAALVAELTTLEAVERPIVVLGDPGAGKSKLTEVLAARLPETDFLPVRVALRAVPADAPVQEQIERAVYDAIGERVSWPDLVRSVPGTLPVVMLDGFDELLQATQVSRSDYLEQVRHFQRREAELGRPAVVLVTSRTVVADRCRIPPGTPVFHLEPFDDERIGQMVELWNGANAARLRRRGVTSLDRDTLLRYRQLAEQPLLLMLLLLYDAEANELQGASADLSRGQLFERLLGGFARREIRKHEPHLDEGTLGQAVERELRRLEVVAMAMFARHQQQVSAEELDRDLAVLLPEAEERATEADLHGALSAAHQVLGRFYFVHEARAHQQNQKISAYEFLHATFGEYLVARAVAAALDQLADDRAYQRRRPRPKPLDDSLLYALTSFAVVAGRAAVVEFLDDILTRRFREGPELRSEYRSLLVKLFQEAPYPPGNRDYAGYTPRRVPIVARQAVYSANLVVLLVLVAEEPVDITELLPDDPDPLDAWRTEANLWRGCLGGDEWYTLAETIRVRHLDYWDEEGRPRTLLSRETGAPVRVSEHIRFPRMRDRGWTRVRIHDATLPFGSWISEVVRRAALCVDVATSRLLLALVPLLEEGYGDRIVSMRENPHGELYSPIHDLLFLRLAEPGEDVSERLAAYRAFVDHWGPGFVKLRLALLRQMAEDATHHRADQAMIEELRGIAEAGAVSLMNLAGTPEIKADAVTPVLDALQSHLIDESTAALVRARIEAASQEPPG